jgi:hypothetical protein
MPKQQKQLEVKITLTLQFQTRVPGVAGAVAHSLAQEWSERSGHSTNGSFGPYRYKVAGYEMSNVETLPKEMPIFPRDPDFED